MQKGPEKHSPVEKIVIWIGSVPSLIFHSLAFTGFFVLTLVESGARDSILLVWNTIVSLEAIYLAIFIQFTVNHHTVSLRGVEEDIDEIQEDVEELGEDVEEMQENIEEISEDVDEDEKRDIAHARNLEALTEDIRRILNELESLKEKK